MTKYCTQSEFIIHDDDDNMKKKDDIAMLFIREVYRLSQSPKPQETKEADVLKIIENWMNMQSNQELFVSIMSVYTFRSRTIKNGS